MITASGMGVTTRPPGPGGGTRPSDSTPDRLFSLLARVQPLLACGGVRVGGGGRGRVCHSRSRRARTAAASHAALRAHTHARCRAPPHPHSHSRWSTGIIHPSGSSTRHASSAYPRSAAVHTYASNLSLGEGGLRSARAGGGASGTGGGAAAGHAQRSVTALRSTAGPRHVPRHPPRCQLPAAHLKARGWWVLGSIRPPR